MVLTGGTTHQSKAGQGDDSVHQWLLGVERVIEEGVHRLGEIQAPAEDRNHTGTAELQLLNGGHVVGVIAGDDVTALQHQADHRALACFVAEIRAAGGPVEVLLEVLEHRGGQRVPDAQIREDLRLGHLHRRPPLTLSGREDVLVRQHQQEVAQVVRRSSQPVLEAEHEAAGVLSLLDRQVLENGGQRVQQFEHGVLKAGATRFLPLFHETGDGALALTQLGHREAAELVEAHHLRHRREDHSRLQTIPMRGDGLHHFLGQILDEDQRGDEDIGLSHIGAETGVIVLVAQLLDQIAAQFDPEVAPRGVQRRGGLGERILILRLQHHIHRLHHGLVVLTLHRSNATIGGADLREHLRTLSNVKNPTFRHGPLRRFPVRRYNISPIGFGVFAAQR